MAQLQTGHVYNPGDVVDAADLNSLVGGATALQGFVHEQTNSPAVPVDPVNDEVVIWDASVGGSGALRRVKVQALPSGVTSVGIAATPSLVFQVTGSPITTTETATVAMRDQLPNKVLAAPASGTGSGPVGFRTLVPADTLMAQTLAALAIDLTLGNYWIKALSGAATTVTIHLNGGAAGQQVTVYLFQQIAPAQTLVNWDTQDVFVGAGVMWPGGVHPVMTRGVVGASDVYHFTCTGSGIYFGTFDQNFKP